MRILDENDNEIINATVIGNIIYLSKETIVSVKAKSTEEADIKIKINKI